MIKSSRILVCASRSPADYTDNMPPRCACVRDHRLCVQAILTPNNAGMFRHRGRPGHGRHQVLSELSYNSTTDESDTERGDGTKNYNDSRSNQAKDATRKEETAKFTPLAGSGNAPKRRMTFGGIRSDKRGEVSSTTVHGDSWPSIFLGCVT